MTSRNAEVILFSYLLGFSLVLATWCPCLFHTRTHARMHIVAKDLRWDRYNVACLHLFLLYKHVSILTACSQSRHLLKVIATLLQFTAHEEALVRHFLASKSWFPSPSP